LLVLLALARLQIRWIAFRLAPVLPFVALGAFGVLLGGSKEMFLQVTVKMLLCVGAAVWLSGTTPFTQLLEAFRKLKVPPLLTVMLSFMFRYLFVLAEEAVRMSRAYQSRCPRRQTLKDAESVGRLAGALMLRTYNRAERIYLAMLSRGFTGEFRTLSVQKLTFADIAFLAFFVGSVTVILVATH
jgi:cobalt/nickel transport system permease protein